MQKDDQEKEKASGQDELSPVWRELLGGLPTEGESPPTPNAADIPTLASDPWNSLEHEQGVEIVDLKKPVLHISDGDVEQMLQRMQEQPTHEGDSSALS